MDVHLNPKIGRDWMLPGYRRYMVTPGQNRKTSSESWSGSSPPSTGRRGGSTSSSTTTSSTRARRRCAPSLSLAAGWCSTSPALLPRRQPRRARLARPARQTSRAITGASRWRKDGPRRRLHARLQPARETLPFTEDRDPCSGIAIMVRQGASRQRRTFSRGMSSSRPHGCYRTSVSSSQERSCWPSPS
jgi:hypothetical protein